MQGGLTKKEQTMSRVKMDSKDIAEIKNSLQVIQLNAECLTKSFWQAPREIIKQVTRIDKLLPVVKFEGGK